MLGCGYFVGVHTKRTSPESSHGFVVNHSHMKALVEPSLTESISPLMSLFTRVAYSVTRVVGSGGACTLEFECGRCPSLLESHHERHRLTAAVEKVLIVA